jgi:excisionase family DNA binding protein
MSELVTVTAPKTLAPLAVDLRQAARLLSLSERTVHDLAKAGAIASVQVAAGGKRLFRIATLEAWLVDRERQGRHDVAEDRDGLVQTSAF